MSEIDWKAQAEAALSRATQAEELVREAMGVLEKLQPPCCLGITNYNGTGQPCPGDASPGDLCCEARALIAKLKAAPLQGEGSSSAGGECHGLDTPERVCFYEQDFYVLSNFSAFNLKWAGWTFPTLEHAYHWEKFAPEHGLLRAEIRQSPSAHEAFRTAQSRKADRRADWDEVKVRLMKGMLREKAHQHEYVRRKLLATGDRELVENSWRDDFWGWGPNRDGQNMLGKLWMEVRAELRVTEGSGVLSLAPDSEIPSASGSEHG